MGLFSTVREKYKNQYIADLFRDCSEYKKDVDNILKSFNKKLKYHMVASVTGTFSMKVDLELATMTIPLALNTLKAHASINELFDFTEKLVDMALVRLKNWNLICEKSKALGYDIALHSKILCAIKDNYLTIPETLILSFDFYTEVIIFTLTEALAYPGLLEHIINGKGEILLLKTKIKLDGVYYYTVNRSNIVIDTTGTRQPKGIADKVHAKEALLK